MPQAQPAAAEYDYGKKGVIWGLVAIVAVYGTMSFFLQTLGVARPKMAAELDGLPLYSWSVSIPSLFSAFVTLIFGKLSDIYGRRIMLLISVIVTLVGTILSAVSQTFVFLIVASVVAAVGTGAMMPLVCNCLASPLHKSVTLTNCAAHQKANIECRMQNAES
jgi:predicted MFS family arabinose efflux permease